MKRVDQLTFTRFAMILLVLFYHGTGSYYMGFLDFFPVSAILRSAPTAVSYLYVLSGFVMALVYFKPGEKLDIAGYWRARFIRIYPLYIISFILTCLYYYDGLFRIKPQKFIANIFVVQAWIPAYAQSFNYSSWSMTVEFFFYALFPFILLWAARQSNRKLVWSSMALWAISQSVHYVLWLRYFPEFRDFVLYFPLFHLSSFVMGVVGGIWYLREGRSAKYEARTVFVLLFTSLLLILAYTAVSTDVYPALPHNLQPMAGLLAPLMVLFIVALALDESRISRTFLHPTLVNLGETAYAIYILHVPMYWLYERALENLGVANPRLVFDITFLPIMVLTGFVVHFYLDIPLRKRLKNLVQATAIRIFLFDLAVGLLTAFFIFKIRFPLLRDYRSFQDMERLVIWLSLLVLPAVSLLVGSCRRAVLEKPFLQWARVTALGVTLGNILLAGIVYAVYLFGKFENFPRSIFLYIWLIMLFASFLIRGVFSAIQTDIPKPIIAAQVTGDAGKKNP